MSSLDIILPSLGNIRGFSDTHDLQRSVNSQLPNQPGQLSPVHKWLGIPYAQASRWERPTPVISFGDGTLECREFGAAPLQARSSLAASVLRERKELDRTLVIPQSEECLFLNVFRPAGDYGERKLPVMVWIYGGGFTIGRADDFQNDPTEFVRNSEKEGQPTIVVTFNYRVGIFGFMAHDDLRSLDKQGLSGNYGMYDQLLALRFVNTQISHFGGDNSNVTLFGVSAGGCSVAMHLARRRVDEEEALFQKAVMMSGTACTLPNKIVNGNYSRYDLLLKEFNIATASPSERVAQLKALSASDLLEFSMKYPREIPWIPEGEDNAEGTWRWPAPQFENGDWDPHCKSVIIGWTKDELTIAADSLCTVEGALAHISRAFGPQISKIEECIEIYNVKDSMLYSHPTTSPGVQFGTDYNCAGPSTVMCTNLSLHANMYTHETPEVRVYFFNTVWDGYVGKQGWGAHHVLDTPFLFGLVEDLGGPEEKVKTSREMEKRWWAFAKGDLSEKDWPKYSDEAPTRIEFLNNGEVEFTSDWKDSRLQYWLETYRNYQGFE